MKSFLSLIAALLLFTACSFAQTQALDQRKTFVYVLHIEPGYLDVSKWDGNVVKEHMARLKSLYDEGTLLHAGRTLQIDEKTFGIVIFYADSFEQAQEVANADPGVKAGMMTTEVFPYMNVMMKGPGK